MEAHYLSPSSFPDGKENQASGNSLAVVMFVEIARGNVPVHAPCNEFRIIRMVAEERYCLHCFGVRWHDVLEGDSPELASIRGTRGLFKARRCRVCDEVVVE